MGQHVNAMTSGTFDAGYTLEPQASTMRKLGVARTIEAGVITKYILGDENGNAFAAGCAITSDFIKNRPDVARRFAAVWKKAIGFVNENPQEARKYLAKNTLTPEDVVDLGANGALLHGRRADGQAQGRVPEIHRLLDRRRHAAGENRHHQVSAGILKHRFDCLRAWVAFLATGARPLWKIAGCSRTDRHPARYASRTCGFVINSCPPPSSATEPDSRRHDRTCPRRRTHSARP